MAFSLSCGASFIRRVRLPSGLVMRILVRVVGEPVCASFGEGAVDFGFIKGEVFGEWLGSRLAQRPWRERAS